MPMEPTAPIPPSDQGPLPALLDWVRGVADSLAASFHHPAQLAENTLAGLFGMILFAVLVWALSRLWRLGTLLVNRVLVRLGAVNLNSAVTHAKAPSSLRNAIG